MRNATKHRRDQETGAEALQFAITAALILLVLFGIIQAGFFYHARSVASGAADKAVQAARVQNGSGGAGQAAGLSFITAAGPGALSNTSVAVTRGTETTTATVRGTVRSTIPFITFPPITATAQGPTERVTG